MRFWLAETLMVGIEWLCIALGHVGGCWVLNRSPLRRVWTWAMDEFYKQQDFAGRHDCPYCSKERELPSRGHEWTVIQGSDNFTGNSIAPVTFTIRSA